MLINLVNSKFIAKMEIEPTLKFRSSEIDLNIWPTRCRAAKITTSYTNDLFGKNTNLEATLLILTLEMGVYGKHKIVKMLNINLITDKICPCLF